MVERGSERIELLGADGSAKNTLIDLSTTGAAFNFPTEVTKDNHLTVKIQDREIDAVVVYCQPKEGGFRIGLQFRNVSSEVRESLQTYVDDFSRGIPLSCTIAETDQGEETHGEVLEEVRDEAQEEA